MPITDRVKRLRQQSLAARETLSSERAELLTRFYQQETNLESIPVHRARSFQYLLEHKAISIAEGELIVGEKGPAPKHAPTYPELCCHSLSDLDILNIREKTSFHVSAKTQQAFTETIIPFWQGRSLRELIFQEMTPEWITAYEAGIFTEFMEQRAPGHTVLDDKIYRKGMLDFIAEIDAHHQQLDYLHDSEAYAKQEELRAMRICAQAIIRFAERHAEKAWELAVNESDPQRKVELERIAEVCAWVPAHAPRDLWEALQAYWFVHLGVTIELNTWDSFCPGHLDQHLERFYPQSTLEPIKGGWAAPHIPQNAASRRHPLFSAKNGEKMGIEISASQKDKEWAEELLHCFWIKFNNQPAPPKVGVTAEESGTYTDFAQINLGGVRPDGSDAVNEVTYLLLDVIEEMRLLQPSSSIQVSKKNPDRFIQRAAKIIRTGFGQPSVFNADLIVQELVRMGKSVVDARCGGSSGCVEVGAFGKEAYILTGYFNIPKILEITLHNGTDPRTGRPIGLQTGDPRMFSSFDELFAAFERQMLNFIDIKVRGNQVIERLYATYMPAPFLSLLIDDCIANGKDYHAGGARYNTSYIQGVGMGTITDALTAVKVHVFDKKTITMEELIAALESNFEGRERLRQRLVNKTPKFGNDDDTADQVMCRVFEAYFNAIEGRRNTRGGEYHINLLPTTVHVYFGSVIEALPDGRRSGLPLSEGISPVQGADRRGPTAVLRSAAKMDHARTGGTLLNQKLTPHLLADEAGLDALVQLIRTYFKLDGHHIQFNVVDAATLRQAQKHPDQHRDLIVRVAGYSDYFCDLSRALQDEIIARTEHQSFDG